MTDKVTILRPITTLDLPPDRVLEAAVGNLDIVAVVGWDKDGKLYLASSLGSQAETLWLLERGKADLLGML